MPSITRRAKKKAETIQLIASVVVLGKCDSYSAKLNIINPAVW